MTRIDTYFDDMSGKMERGAVLEIFPKVFRDPRGSFSEVLTFSEKDDRTETGWITGKEWIEQINRSKSVSGVFRGFHAQRGPHCQGKLVEAVNRKIFDVILDMRPDSSTFGEAKSYLLDPNEQNMVFVPRGFLHGFVVPFEYSTEKAIFQYYCDNLYDKESEVCANPKSVLDAILSGKSSLDHDFISTVSEHELIFSEKDESAPDVKTVSDGFLLEYVSKGRPWYV